MLDPDDYLFEGDEIDKGLLKAEKKIKKKKGKNGKTEKRPEQDSR